MRAVLTSASTYALCAKRAAFALAVAALPACGLSGFQEAGDHGSGGTSIGVGGEGNAQPAGGQVSANGNLASAVDGNAASTQPDAGAAAGATTDTPAPVATTWVGPAGLFTAAAVAQVPTTADVEAEIDSQFLDNTQLDASPMGSRFAQAIAHPPSAASLALLQNTDYLPPIPSALNWSWRPFAVTLYPQRVPLASDLHQNGLGDCDGISPLAGLVQQNPTFVRGLIQAQDTSHFVVHMFDPWGKPVDVTVDNRFVANANLQGVSTAANAAMWATVLEKAVMVYNSGYRVWDGTDNPGGIGAIGSEAMLPMFTGNGASVGYYAGSLSPEAMRVVVARAVRSGCVLTGGFLHGGQVGNWAVDSGHGYSVVAPGGDGNAMLQMRNPWGWLNHAGQGDIDRSTDGTFIVMKNDPLQPTMDMRVISGGASSNGGNAAPFAGPAR